MSQLNYLMREIGAGVEIFYSSKSTGQFVKSAFVLCDNYTELLSKLFLIEDNPNWLDIYGKKAKKLEIARKNIEVAYKNDTVPAKDDVEIYIEGTDERSFRNYNTVIKEVQAVFQSKRSAEVSMVDNLHNRMKERHLLRNDFFHSAKLLQLSIDRSHCIEAFCDLLDYGELLFQEKWKNVLPEGRTLGTLEVLLRLEKKSYSNPSLISKVEKILKNCPQYLPLESKNISATKKGIQITEYPADLHFILSVIGGGQELRDKLAALLL